MNGLFRLACACVVATSGIAVSGAYGTDEANEYSINMTRAMEVGQHFNVRAKGTQQVDLRNPSTDDVAGASRVMTMTLEGTATVMAVDRNGRPTAIEYRVANCTMNDNGTARTIAPKGAKLTARDQNGMTVWQIDGRPASEDVNAALSMFGLFTGDETVDEMIGTDRPRTVGESWAIDREGVAKAMAKELNTDVDAKSVFGASTLVETVEHAGTPCTVVYTHVSADGCLPPALMLEGFNVRESSASATFQGIFPEDSRLPAMSNARSMMVKARVTDRNGAERELNWSRYVEFETMFDASADHVATGAEVEIADE